MRLLYNSHYGINFENCASLAGIVAIKPTRPTLLELGIPGRNPNTVGLRSMYT